MAMDALQQIADVSRRERSRIAACRPEGADMADSADKVAALRDRADVALLRGDVPDPDEGW
jgi:hypothetical protein